MQDDLLTIALRNRYSYQFPTLSKAIIEQLVAAAWKRIMADRIYGKK